MKGVILLDVDGVLANFSKSFLAVANEVCGTEVKFDDITDYNIYSFFPADKKQEVKARISEEGFCSSIEVLPGAQEAVEELKKIANVYTLSAPVDSKTWVYERDLWLRNNFGISHHNQIFTHSKHLVFGHVLIEDSFDNVAVWARFNPGGKLGLLWETPYNKNSNQAVIYRSNSWNDILFRINRWLQMRGL